MIDPTRVPPDRATSPTRLRDAAYASRAKCRWAVAQVVLDHEDGKDGLCWCGQGFPCRAWKKLEEANTGIPRQLERWSSWDDDFLAKHMSQERGSRRLVIDENEPADEARMMDEQRDRFGHFALIRLDIRWGARSPDRDSPTPPAGDPVRRRSVARRPGCGPDCGCEHCRSAHSRAHPPRRPLWMTSPTQRVRCALAPGLHVASARERAVSLAEVADFRAAREGRPRCLGKVGGEGAASQRRMSMARARWLAPAAPYG